MSLERPITIPREDQPPAPVVGTGGSLAVRVLRYFRYILRNIRENPILYLMVLPGVLYFVVFKYGPMYGATVAFKDYRVLDGIVGSPWVGFEHFEAIFNSFYFGNVLATTLDEFLAVADAFTNNDPDGNGQNDIFGWSGFFDPANAPSMTGITTWPRSKTPLA